MENQGIEERIRRPYIREKKRKETIKDQKWKIKRKTREKVRKMIITKSRSSRSEKRGKRGG